MPRKPTGTVLLQDDNEWNMPHSCRTTNQMMIQLVTQNPAAITGMVLPEMGLDLRTRRLKENLIPVDKEGKGSTLHDKNWINKALAMELLAATTLTCLDDPTSVYAPCAIDDNGNPKTFAQGGNGDALAYYPSFSILMEVSSKIDMSYDNFRTQMDQAIKHGSVVAKETGRPVYALVVNECQIEQEKGMLDIYNSFLPIEAEMGDVRPIPIWSADFVEIVRQIHPPGKLVEFDHRALAAALDKIYSQLEQRVDRLDLGFTANTIVRNLVNPPAPAEPGFDFNA